MGTRREITKQYARDDEEESKKVIGVIPDELVAVTGRSRANARRALSTARKRTGPAKAVPCRPRPRPRTYGYNTLKVQTETYSVGEGAATEGLPTTIDRLLKLLSVALFDEGAVMSGDVGVNPGYSLFSVIADWAGPLGSPHLSA
ncbi:hypothetical protein [Paenarthrobacter sp. PH39-S1]|uniref:hypothetical protein n=1 Tax=Paenarthrobacter sp. PH39-S1 TaxID=3046204 RepID=UPI0024BB90E3|nr:hypothetical protein [Paenarthrobacter sp. PH39-S1]MDJ0358063.1 hypothetical protein [Paenarthrobacter sp. PH39-S1]